MSLRILTSSETTPMRDKEVVQDYRFLPEPNLPPLRLLKSCEACTSHSPPPDLKQPVCIGCIQRRHNADLVQLPNHLRRDLVFKHRLSFEQSEHLVDELQLRSLYFSTSELILSQLPVIEQKVSEIHNTPIEDLNFLVYREVAFWCCGLLYSRKRYF